MYILNNKNCFSQANKRFIIIWSGRIQLSLKIQFIEFDFDVPLGQQFTENLRSKINIDTTSNKLGHFIGYR